MTATTEQPRPSDAVSALTGEGALRRRKPDLLADAGLVLSVLVVAVVAFLAGQRAGDPGLANTMRAKGTLTLTDEQTELNHCVGTNGFDDIGPTTPVLVFQDGRLVAFTALGPGQADDRRRTCTWSWSIDGVPKGGGTYSVQVSHRGWNTFTEHQLTSGRAVLQVQRPAEKWSTSTTSPPSVTM